MSFGDGAFMCGLGGSLDLPDAGEGLCCIGSAMRGPQGCTCWEPVYDLDQQPCHRRRAVERSEQCIDCAYRSDSPERHDVEDYKGDAGLLDYLVASGRPFYCHQGIRRPERFEHRPEDCSVDDLSPDRVSSIPGHSADYSPPMRWGLPFKADGTPADVCAGWAARRRAFLAAVGAEAAKR